MNVNYILFIWFSLALLLILAHGALNLYAYLYDKKKGVKPNSIFVKYLSRVTIIIPVVLILSILVYGFGSNIYKKNKLFSFVNAEDAIIKIDSTTLVDKNLFIADFRSISAFTLYAGRGGDEYSLEITLGSERYSFTAIEMTNAFRLYRIEDSHTGEIYGYLKSKKFPNY